MAHKPVRVSVVIPTFNRREKVRLTIESVLNQTRLPDEIIVVDDGSKDDTSVMIRQLFPQVMLVSQENRGVSAARNAGIRLSTGDWIAFLDSDDSWQPDKLVRHLAYASLNPDIRISQTNETWIRNGKFANPMKKHEKMGGWIFKECLSLCLISPSAVMIRREVFHDRGLFDEEFPACEDYDLWLRITAFEPVGFLPDKLVTKTGGHADQLSRKYTAMDRFRVQSILNILQHPDLKKEDRVEALKMVEKKCGILEKGFRRHGKPEEARRFQRIRENARAQLDKLP